MKKTLLLTLILSISVVFNFTTAQSKKTIKDSSTVIIFNQSPSAGYHKKASIGEDNIIKIAPLGFLGGGFPLLYERKLTNFLSVQLSAGITSKNYVRSLIAKESNPAMIYSWKDENISDMSEHIYSFDYRKPKLGFMAAIQPRIYFESDGLEGPFLGLAFDYYKFNFDIPSYIGSAGNYSQSGPMVSESEKIKDFMVHFGNQVMYDRITVEYTSAIGLRNVDGLKYAAGTTYNNQLVTGTATYKQTVINFNIGFKVGYHF